MQSLAVIKSSPLFGARSLFALLFSLVVVLATVPVAPAGGQNLDAASGKSSAETPSNGQDIISLASANVARTNSGDGESHTTSISADGRFVVFTSGATNLVAGLIDTNGAPDVFVYDRLNNFTRLVSHNGSANSTPNGASGVVAGGAPSISADGQYIVYSSLASDILPFDTNGVSDVFLYHMSNGANWLVSSKSTAGTAVGNGPSNGAVISANGRLVVFTSSASDLSTTNDTNGKVDIYARNLDNLVTKLVTMNAAGNNGGNDHSSVGTPPSISDDGRFVAFDSQAGNLVSNDTNGAGAFGTDVFVRDLQSDTTALASINSAGTGSGNLNSFGSGVRISGNGNFAVFASNATNLVTGVTDSNANLDIFIRNLVAGSTAIVSVNPAGNAAGINLSKFHAVSDDGRFVAFTSRASNLVPVDTNNGLEGGGGIEDVFVRDMLMGATELVSINSAGTDSGNSSSSGQPEISADGRYILFSSGATNLTNVSDPNSSPELLLRDLQTDSTKLITIDRFGNAAGCNTAGYSLSSDGRVVAFESLSPVLVANDTNGKTDVFASGPPIPGLSVSDVTVTEGDSGSINANFTVTLVNGPASGNVTATVITFIDTASEADFNPVLEDLTFGPGETTKTVTVAVLGDTIFEGNESFILDLRNAVGAAVVDGVGVGTIIDNEQALSLSVNDVVVTEGDSGTKDVVFTVTLSGTSSVPVGFGFGLTNGTALEEEDFMGVGGGSIIFVGSTTQTISVPIIGDTIAEPNETFFLNLANPSNASISDAQGVATITDDESSSKPPTVQFRARQQSVSEGGKSIVIEVARSGNLSAPAVVEYATSAPFSASDRSDYSAAFGRLTYAAGESSKTFTVFITDDVFVEGPERFKVILTNPTGGASLGFPDNAIIEIVDNDTSSPGSNPIDSAPFFVRQHYVDFLNREPDALGLAFWTNQITSCGANAACIELKRVNVSAAFFLSIEFQQTGYLVYRTFKAAYGNLSPTAPVPLTFNDFLAGTQLIAQGVVVNAPGWEQQLETNKAAFFLDFVSRLRFSDAYPTTMSPEAFVDALFTKAVVTPSAAERSAAIGEFNLASDTANTVARGRALRRVAENATLDQQEKDRAFVLMQYFGYLRRNPNDAPEPGLNFDGYNFWLNKLVQFNGDYIAAEMVKAFISSDEYRRRFGP